MSGRISALLLVAAGVVLMLGALLASPGERLPIYGLEANGLAVAESVAADRDLTFDSGDLARYRERHGVGPEGIHLEGEREEGGRVFAHHWLWGVVAAPWVALGESRGVALVNALLLLGAVAISVRSLRRRLGADALGLVLVVFFFSWLPAFVFVAHPALLSFAATVGALGIVFRDELPALSETPELFEPEHRPTTRLGLDLLAGALAAVPLVQHPLYLLVPLGLVLAVPRGGRGGRGAAILAGALIGFACVVALRMESGLGTPWFRDVAVFDASIGFEGESGRAAGPFAEGRLGPNAFRAGGWSLLGALLGRSVGWLPYFLPVLLLLSGWKRGVRSGLALSAIGGAALLAILLPFDFAGYTAIAGNWAVLPFYAMLIFVPSKVPGRFALTATAVLAAVVLWPLWIDPYSVRPNAGRTTRFVAPGVERHLPVETTLRDFSRAAEDGSKGLRVEPLSRSIRVIGGRDLEWSRDLGPAELLVSAPAGVERIFLDFDKNGDATLELDGGALVETLFRPSGRVGVVVQLADGRSHPTAAGLEPTTFYRLRFWMDDAASDTIRLRCSADTVGG